MTPVILLFLIRNRRLFDAPMVMPFYIGSFGNTFFALDFTARLYAGYPISVVMVRDPEQNFYLPAMFQENMTFYWVDTLGFAPYTVSAVLRTLVYLICPLVGISSIIEGHVVYRTLAVLSDRVVGSEEQDRLLPVLCDRTGYSVYLLENGIGPRPHLPPDLVARCKSFIASRHPEFFTRPFITLVLRSKGHNDSELSTRCRSSGPMENYSAAVAHALSCGYHVVGTGDTVNSVFADLPGFFDLGEVPGAPGLLNIFLLSNCALYWGQHSGPSAIANSCGIPCLITDALPYCNGTLATKGKDIILYKPLTIRGRETPLNMVEVYTQHQDLAYGYGFAGKGVSIGWNSASDLLKAIEEALERLSTPPPADVLVLEQKLRELIEPAMPARYQFSRPPEFVLRNLPLAGK